MFATQVVLRVRSTEGPADCAGKESCACSVNSGRDWPASQTQPRRWKGEWGSHRRIEDSGGGVGVSGKWEGAADHAGRESCSGSLNRSKDWPASQTQSWRREGDAGCPSQNRRCRRWCGCRRKVVREIGSSSEENAEVRRTSTGTEPWE